MHAAAATQSLRQRLAASNAMPRWALSCDASSRALTACGGRWVGHFVPPRDATLVVDALEQADQQTANVDVGAYDELEVGRLGYLQSLAFRACRMVVDTGLHHKRWSRVQAVEFFVERNGSKREEVESEVDRYCSWPGQACGYKVGHSEIVRQRARAQQGLGCAFDLKAFNDAVILGGNPPLDVLAKNVERYMNS